MSYATLPASPLFSAMTVITITITSGRSRDKTAVHWNCVLPEASRLGQEPGADLGARGAKLTPSPLWTIPLYCALGVRCAVVAPGAAPATATRAKSSRRMARAKLPRSPSEGKAGPGDTPAGAAAPEEPHGLSPLLPARGGGSVGSDVGQR